MRLCIRQSEDGYMIGPGFSREPCFQTSPSSDHTEQHSRRKVLQYRNYEEPDVVCKRTNLERGGSEFKRSFNTSPGKECTVGHRYAFSIAIHNIALLAVRYRPHQTACPEIWTPSFRCLYFFALQAGHLPAMFVVQPEWV